MIFGKKEDLNLYRSISENMAKGIDFLLNSDSSLPNGRYEIDGEKVYANVISGNTKLSEDNTYEAHRRYIDLQYVVSGSEDTGFAHVSDCTVDVPYKEKEDYLKVKGEGSEVRVSSGYFYIAFPCDAHRPMCSKEPNEIKKIIVKILV